MGSGYWYQLSPSPCPLILLMMTKGLYRSLLPCDYCGGIARYKGNGACAICPTRKIPKASPPPKIPKASPPPKIPKASKTRQGLPCGRCGGTVKFVWNHLCVACVEAREQIDLPLPTP